MGPAQLRRVRRVLRGPVGVGHAGRRAGRAARSSRYEAGHHRRRLGRRRVSLLTASRHPESAAGLAIWWISGGVLRPVVTGHPLLRRVAVGAAWNDGMEAVATCPSGRGAGAATPPTATLPDQDRGDVHLHHGELDAGLLPSRRRARARPPRRRRPRARTSPPWSSAAARATPTTPAPPPRRWPICCPRPGSSSRHGATVSGSSARGAREEGLFAHWPELAPTAPGVAGRRSRLTACRAAARVCALLAGGHRPFTSRWSSCPLSVTARVTDGYEGLLSPRPASDRADSSAI